MEDLYCTIFVSTDRSRSALAELIAEHLNGKARGVFVNTEYLLLEVLENEDFDPQKCEDAENGFLFYPLCLDIEPVEHAPKTSYIHDVARLLTALRSAECKAVAACEFEEQLPL